MDLLDTQSLHYVLEFQIKRGVTNLSKTFLNILEDLRDQNYNINTDTYTQLRKRVLDNSNNLSRELVENIEKFDLKLKVYDEDRKADRGETEYAKYSA